MTNIIEIIEQEMEQYKGDRSRYLNNFFMNLPDETCKQGGYYREVVTSLGWMDLSPVESGANPQEEKERGASDLYLNQKRREFFATIDAALVESEISMEDLQRLQEEGRGDGSKIRRLYELIFPVYVKLREKGYSHRDLIA